VAPVDDAEITEAISNAIACQVMVAPDGASIRAIQNTVTGEKAFAVAFWERSADPVTIFMTFTRDALAGLRNLIDESLTEAGGLDAAQNDPPLSQDDGPES
jgi:hypothetical protein